MGDHIQVDPRPGIDLPAKVVERHQQGCRENVSLMFDLAVLGIPANEVLLPASDAVGIIGSMQKVVPELVRERKIYAPE